ncbi:conserved membrane hypothetical protein [uncultured Sporomusa sp.]|uniref:Membrane protein YkvI n=1 Tax=uncultured Sporomusa sp. TaxID=307249 RepID=A0A212M1Z2_9FIRM|nr:hypothetical protein [uncultured Sporomusa sp.]SCM83785.1 conserved membrane hypothetical protein [uncultured Sporomusa sp.]
MSNINKGQQLTGLPSAEPGGRKPMTMGWGVGLSMGAAWFATHCGGGFATGNQEVNFYVRFGWYSIILPIFAMIILGWCHRNALVLAKDHKAYNYKAYADVLFHPYEKYFGLVFEFGNLMLIACAVSTAIAGAGSLLQSTIGLNYGIGITAVGFVTLVLTIFGGQLVIKALNFKAYFLVPTLGLLAYLGIESGALQWKNFLATQESFGTSFGEAFWLMLIYIGFQSFTIMPMLSAAQGIKSTKECNWFMVFGTLFNGVFLLLVCIMLLGFAPGSLKQTLPVYYVTTQLGIDWLKVLYSVILFVALLGSGVALTFAAVARFESVIKPAGMFASLQMRRVFVSFITIAICTGISIFGLTNIVVKGYGSVGYIGLFFVIIPELIVGTIKIRNNARKRKEMGIDEDAL